MIKKRQLSLFLSASILFISCKKELEPQDSSGIVPPTTSATAVPAPVTPGTTAQAPAIPVQPTTVSTQPQMQTVSTQPQMQKVITPAAPAKVLPGMNPPHGQPGHRCDIPVGAPLNSAPKPVTSGKPTTVTPMQNNAVAVPTTPSSAPAILTPNATATTTPPGMNPPHGQEGHVCSVAVGAPLPKT